MQMEMCSFLGHPVCRKPVPTSSVCDIAGVGEFGQLFNYFLLDSDLLRHDGEQPGDVPDVCRWLRWQTRLHSRLRSPVCRGLSRVARWSGRVGSGRVGSENVQILAGRVDAVTFYIVYYIEYVSRSSN